jgi:hypothetical protein
MNNYLRKLVDPEAYERIFFVALATVDDRKIFARDLVEINSYGTVGIVCAGVGEVVDNLGEQGAELFRFLSVLGENVF